MKPKKLKHIASRLMQSEKVKHGPDKGTDAAALFIGIVAAALSPISEPGPWSIINVAVSVALICTILGYAWENQRTRLQSVAVAAVIGLAIIPFVGFILDSALGPRIVNQQEDSQLTPFWAFTVWVVGASITYWRDCLQQPSPVEATQPPSAGATAHSDQSGS